jgi:hypothetical protein
MEIRVVSSDSILNLVNSINKLRAMTIYVRQYEQAQPPYRTETELEWVQRHLSSRCLISTGPNFGDAFIIKLWFN